MTELRLKRAYENAEEEDGYRVYVDRLWPRGLSHETFHYDVWEKEIAPSDALRHWFHDDPDARWQDFEEKYRAELLANPRWAEFVKSLEPYPVVTLLYSSKNETENNALVLVDVLCDTFPDHFKQDK
ncbi:MAG: DUF488 family protein [Muribaculaceae bacterium]|nr:DUF488 family protein [Muribaculaceae bacterium]